VGCLQLSARGISQTITLSVKDADLQTVFTAIEKQTDYVFFVRKQLLQNAKRVTLTVSGASLQQVLDLCFKDQPFTYLIAGKMITISRRAEKASVGTTIQTTNQDGQLVNVKGRVVNENNDPVEGVNVNVKGTATITSTNANGEFALKGVDENATLIFTSVSVESFEVKVKGRAFLDVAVQTKITSMQEIVVNKGYYTEKQKFATGNVVTVKAKDIEKQPVNNPLLALVGRVPGVTIEQQTGFANSGVVVRIQGRNSINSGLDPLYVIDGVPYLSQPMPTTGLAKVVLGNSGGGVLTGGGNPLSFINPSDIESIDILKDADATAIYGSRGANGVILITTKKGRAGQARVNANFRTGWGRVNNKVDLLNTEQYLGIRKEAYLNDGLPVPNKTTTPDNSNFDLTYWSQNRFTDWQKELIGGTARYTDGQISVSGGSSNTQFLISTGYHRETTVLPDDFSDKKESFAFNVNHLNSDQKFKIQGSAIYTVDENEIPNADVTALAMRLSPNAPSLYNPDGSLNWEPITIGTGTVSTWLNPLSNLLNRYNNKVYNLIISSLLSYQLLSNLSVSSRMGYTYLQSDEVSVYPLTSTRPEQRTTTQRIAQYANGNSSSWIVEPQITYKLINGKGKFEALVGTSFQQQNNKRQAVNGFGYSSDLLLKNISSAATITPASSLYSLYKYNAVFGRLNYNYSDKYVVNITARRDGSSRFGSENLFNNLWGVAGSWIFSKEKWVSQNLSFINFGKLRLSYGTTGNDQIGDYAFMNLYSPETAGVPYQGISAMSPTGHANPYLQWEETKKLQFGLDFGLLKDRIIFNMNYYLNRSSNLLVQTKLSYITGFPGILGNFSGVVENRGWELSFVSRNIQGKNFSWTTNANLTIPIRNGQLISFPDISSTIYANTYAVGKSLYDVKSFHLQGVDPITGLFLFSDSKGNPTIIPSVQDRIAFSNTSQRLFSGLQNTVMLKGFELDFTFQFVKKNAPVFIGGNPGQFRGTGNTGNQPLIVLSRWQMPGDISKMQKLSASFPSAIQTAYFNYIQSDGAFTDASFVRLTNISFSYQMPRKWLKEVCLQNAKVYIQGQNVFTITKYKGLNPATGSSTSLPPLQIITVGGQIIF
jgi:TonB-linked SusC/RagA family outer membrane protein